MNNIAYLDESRRYTALLKSDEQFPVVDQELRNGTLYAANDAIPTSLLAKSPDCTASEVAGILDSLRVVAAYHGVTILANNTGIDLNELCAKYNDRAGSQMVIRDKANVELGINKRLVEYNDPVIAFDYSDEGYRAIGFIINCDHPDALLYLTCLHAVLVDYLYLGIEPESDYIRDYLFEHGQGFNNKDMFGYGYFSKPNDIIEAAAYADARNNEYEWTK